MLHSHLYNMQIQMMTPHFVGMCGVFGTPSFNRVQEHILFPHICIVHIQGDRVECYRGVVCKITNNGEELLEEHEYFYTSVYEDR